MATEIELKNGQKVSKKLVFKIIKLMFWSLISKLMFRRGFYLPRIPEIKAEQLNERLNSGDQFLLIDLRVEDELETDGYIKNSQMIPFFRFLTHIENLPKDKEIVTICPGGGASLIGAEILINSGFPKVKSLKGGIRNWKKKQFPLVEYKHITEAKSMTIEKKPLFLQGKESLDEDKMIEVHHSLNVRNYSCPVPVLESRKAIKKVKIGQVLEILSTDPGSIRDIPSWAIATNQELVSYNDLSSKGYRFLVRRLK